MKEAGQEWDPLPQAIRYFGENPGFHRLFEAFCAKYRSYGGFQGTAIVEGVTSREAEALSGFLGVSVARGATIRLTAAGFTKALAKTRFHGIDPVELLKAISPLPLGTNQEADASRQEAQTQWLATRTGSTAFLAWLGLEWNRPHSMLRRMWTEAQNEVKNALQASSILGRETDDVGKAWDALPLPTGTRERLPVFATSLLQDPHAFDVGTFRGRLLMRALASRRGRAVPETAEERAAVLAHFGVLPDDVSSRVLISGLSATLRSGGTHPGWEGFRQVGSPFYATVADLCQIQGISAPDRCVWVLENPTVFMAMQEKAAEHDIPTGLVCTAGQPDLACWLVLDDLVTSGFTLRYAGDFDPEGLLMAQRMLQRYGDDCRLWHMSVEDYEATHPSVPLPTERISKLAGVRQEALLATAEAIQKKGLAGYQEALVDMMVPWETLNRCQAPQWA
jgi:uncharacterized protein (TIGR02679 family)